MKNNLHRFVLVLFFSAALGVTGMAATLTSLGRVLPRSGLIDVRGVPGDTIEQINVAEGAWIEAGQSLGRLSSAEHAARELARAEANLKLLRDSLAKDIEIARGRVTLAEAEAKFAREKLGRVAAARDSDFISPDQIEERTLQRQSADLKLIQASQDLAKANRDAEDAIHQAENRVATARTQLSQAELRAPIRARVLKSRARPGATVGPSELFRLGDTAGMIVVVEVYEADALKVKNGQKATISSPALPRKMTGRVESISAMVARNALESMDPNESAQSRIVEVTVKMDETEPLDRLVLLQVDVTIDL